MDVATPASPVVLFDGQWRRRAQERRVRAAPWDPAVTMSGRARDTEARRRRLVLLHTSSDRRSLLFPIPAQAVGVPRSTTATRRPSKAAAGSQILRAMPPRTVQSHRQGGEAP